MPLYFCSPLFLKIESSCKRYERLTTGETAIKPLSFINYIDEKVI